MMKRLTISLLMVCILAACNAQAAPPTPADPVAALQRTITDALSKSNRSVPRVRAVDFNVLGPGDLRVSWSINDNLSSDLIRAGAQMDAAKILQVISGSPIPYTTAFLQGYYGMQDVYGNVTEKNVVSVAYGRATVDKINWPNFSFLHVYDIAGQVKIDPAFRP